MRVQFLKRHLEERGHRCVVLNIGQSRAVPSDEYETVLGGMDYLRKVWRFSREGYTAHVHVNGASPQGFLLAIAAEIVNLASGKRPFLTFHAGTDQLYFPRPKAPLLLPVYWLLFAIPQRIICNSDAVKAKIQEYGVPGEKIVPIQAFSRQYLEFERVSLGADVDAFYNRFRQVIFCYINIRQKFHPVEMIEGVARVAGRAPDVALLMCGVAGYADDRLWAEVQQRIAMHDLHDRVFVVDDFEHDRFLTALTRSALYLRTHVSDGVCSSVLEALALGVPVVAAENGQRPAGVVTFDVTNPDDLADKVQRVLELRDSIALELPAPDIPDTLAQEADLLTTVAGQE